MSGLRVINRKADGPQTAQLQTFKLYRRVAAFGRAPYKRERLGLGGFATVRSCSGKV